MIDEVDTIEEVTETVVNTDLEIIDTPDVVLEDPAPILPELEEEAAFEEIRPLLDLESLNDTSFDNTFNNM